MLGWFKKKFGHKGNTKPSEAYSEDRSSSAVPDSSTSVQVSLGDSVRKTLSTNSLAANSPGDDVTASPVPAAEGGNGSPKKEIEKESNISFRMWTDAYENLRKSKPDLVIVYETILSQRDGAGKILGRSPFLQEVLDLTANRRSRRNLRGSQ